MRTKKNILDGRKSSRSKFMHRKSDMDGIGLNLGLHCEKLASKSLNHCMIFLDLATGTNIVDTLVKLSMNI